MNLTFKKLVLLSALTVLLGVGLVFALSYAFKPSAQTLLMAEGVNGQFELKLTMTLEKTEYSLGEPINITLTITNISNQTINFTIGSPLMDFWVYNDTNSDLYRWSSSRVFPMVIGTIPFNAGESLTEHLIWPQTCNDTPFSEGISVSPGTYYIVGQAHWYNLQTPPIQVTIVKP